jgi:hypothetical protein
MTTNESGGTAAQKPAPQPTPSPAPTQDQQTQPQIVERGSGISIVWSNDLTPHY